MKRSIFLLGTILLFFPAALSAGDLTLSAGYLNPGNLSLSNAFNPVIVFRGTSVYGASFEADFHSILGVEEAVSFSPRLFSSNLIPDETNVRGFLYNSNLVLNAPLGHLVPYATVGMGFMKPWGTGFKPFGTRFAFNYGGGIKLRRLMGPIGLRFEVRGYSIPDVSSQTLNILEASGGITISIGRRR